MRLRLKRKQRVLPLKPYNNYPLREMKTVGDSFFVPGMDAGKLMSKVSNRALGQSKIVGCADVIENGVVGARCWLVKIGPFT